MLYFRQRKGNGGGVPILAEILTKEFPGTSSFVIILVTFTKLFPSEDFLCDVTATGVPLFARKQAKE